MLQAGPGIKHFLFHPLAVSFICTVQVKRCAPSQKRSQKRFLQNLQTILFVLYPFYLFPPCVTHEDGQGKNLVHLIDRPDEPYCFRLQKDRVYYVSESSMRLGISVARSNLVSLGTCFGKFSKSGKFKLHITALDYVAQYAKYKVSPPPYPSACSSLNVF
jgi:hypothetical protein